MLTVDRLAMTVAAATAQGWEETSPRAVLTHPDGDVLRIQPSLGNPDAVLISDRSTVYVVRVDNLDEFFAR